MYIDNTRQSPWLVFDDVSKCCQVCLSSVSFPPATRKLPIGTRLSFATTVTETGASISTTSSSGKQYACMYARASERNESSEDKHLPVNSARCDRGLFVPGGVVARQLAGSREVRVARYVYLRATDTRRMAGFVLHGRARRWWFAKVASISSISSKKLHGHVYREARPHTRCIRCTCLPGRGRLPCEDQLCPFCNWRKVFD